MTGGRFNVVRVKGIVRDYSWGLRGDESIVAAALASPANVNKDTCYAELWYGEQSLCVRGGEEIPMREWLEEQEMPYLAKLLAVGKPLSLQLHPDSAGATKLQSQVEYSDAREKAEMVISLCESFEALCGFRKTKEISMMASSVPGFQEFFDESIIALENPEADLKLVLKRILEAPAAQIRDAIDKVLALDYKKAEPIKKDNNGVIKDAAIKAYKTMISIFKDETTSVERLRTSLKLFHTLHENYPYDRGVFAAFLLNYVRLKAGESLIIAPNTLHTYLSGQGFELMSNSDTVLRVGLTPKKIDIPNSLDLLSYQTVNPACLTMKPVEVPIKYEFSSPLTSNRNLMRLFAPLKSTAFRMYHLRLIPGCSVKDLRLPLWTPMTIFSVKGSCVVTFTRTESVETVEETLQPGQNVMVKDQCIIGVRNSLEKANPARARSTSGLAVDPYTFTDLDTTNGDVHLLITMPNLEPTRIKRSPKIESPNSNASVLERGRSDEQEESKKTNCSAEVNESTPGNSKSFDIEPTREVCELKTIEDIPISDDANLEVSNAHIPDEDIARTRFSNARETDSTRDFVGLVSETAQARSTPPPIYGKENKNVVETGQSEVTAEIWRSDFPAEIWRSDFPAEIGRSDFPAEIGRSDFPAEIGRSDFPGEIGRSDATAEIGRSDFTGEIGRSDVTAESGPSDVTAEIGPSEITAEIGPSETVGGEPEASLESVAGAQLGNPGDAELNPFATETEPASVPNMGGSRSNGVAANVEITLSSPRGGESVASTRAKNSPVDGHSPLSGSDDTRRSATRLKEDSTEGSIKSLRPSMPLLIDEH